VFGGGLGFGGGIRITLAGATSHPTFLSIKSAQANRYRPTSNNFLSINQEQPLTGRTGWKPQTNGGRERVRERTEMAIREPFMAKRRLLWTSAHKKGTWPACAPCSAAECLGRACACALCSDQMDIRGVGFGRHSHALGGSRAGFFYRFPAGNRREKYRTGKPLKPFGIPRLPVLLCRF
jgi:hypothetical protein